MSEYIEREVVLKAIVDEQTESHVGWGNAGYEIGYHNGLTMAKSIGLTAPAADVVAVVRCKDCRYSDEAYINERGFTICPASGMEITDDDFCSYGERRSDNV